MWSLAGVIVGALFTIGVLICFYWAQSCEKAEAEKNMEKSASKGKTPLAILILVLIIASCASPEGVITRNKYEGYTVVKSYPVDSLRDFHVIMNDKRYVEIYTPKWWKDMYQVGDTIK